MVQQHTKSKYLRFKWHALGLQASSWVGKSAYEVSFTWKTHFYSTVCEDSLKLMGQDIQGYKDCKDHKILQLQETPQILSGNLKIMLWRIWI